MKYNLSGIMINAHRIRKTTGASMSAALRKAWATAKVEVIDNQRFNLNMKDGWSAEDFETDRRLSARRLESVTGAGIELPPESVRPAPAPVMVKNPALTAEQVASIENSMFDMMTRRLYNGTFDMDEYKELESRLFISVPGGAVA